MAIANWSGGSRCRRRSFGSSRSQRASDRVATCQRARPGRRSRYPRTFVQSTRQSLVSGISHYARRALGPRWPSALALVVANLAPVYGVLVLGWPVYPLILLFWVENVVIGVINVMRMAMVDPASVMSWLSKVVMVPFFCVHYGIFTAAHGAFLHQTFVEGRSGGIAEIFTPGLWVMRITDLGLWIPVALLASSHLFSFSWNYIRRGEYRTAVLDKLMTQPYARVVLLHVVVWIGGLAILRIESPVWALLLLVGVKIILDLHAHLREHRRLGGETMTE